MQSLALDVKPMRDDGARLEIAEEDDELLRAAEELGVDLSPDRLRSTPRDPDVQEVEAGVEEIDLEGELHVAADEQLTEVVVDGSDDNDDDAAPLGAVEFDLEPAEWHSALEFLSLPADSDAHQLLTHDGGGRCVMRDQRKRIGAIQIEPAVSDEEWAAMDTTPREDVVDQ